jgi:hypothetical protein
MKCQQVVCPLISSSPHVISINRFIVLLWHRFHVLLICWHGRRRRLSSGNVLLHMVQRDFFSLVRPLGMLDRCLSFSCSRETLPTTKRKKACVMCVAPLRFTERSDAPSRGRKPVGIHPGPVPVLTPKNTSCRSDSEDKRHLPRFGDAEPSSCCLRLVPMRHRRCWSIDRPPTNVRLLVYHRRGGR